MSLVSCHHVSLLSTPFPSPCERVPSFSQPASSCISSSATILDTCRTPARRIYCCSRDYIFSRTVLTLQSRRIQKSRWEKSPRKSPPDKLIVPSNPVRSWSFKCSSCIGHKNPVRYQRCSSGSFQCPAVWQVSRLFLRRLQPRTSW